MKCLFISFAFLATALAAHAQSWTNRFDGPLAGNDTPAGIAVDAAGDVLVTGYSYDNGDNPQYATLKYSSAGIPLWTNYYPGSANEVALAQAVATDTNGNVFVTGYTASKISDPGSTIGDYVTIKYSSIGSALWTNRYNGANNPDDAGALVVDSGGNVIVTGTSVGGSSQEDWATIKLSSAGVLSWARRLQSANQDQASGLAVDNDSNVYVTGLYDGMMTTIKYAPAGTVLWTKNYNPAFGSGKALAVDGGGNVYVTGSVDNPAGGSDVVTLKYSSAGTPLWTNRYDGPGISGDSPTALALTDNGDPIVTGVGWDGSAYEYVTIKYSNSGVPLWTNRCGPVPQQFYGSMGPFLKVDANGNTFFAGTSGTGYGTEDWLTIKYSPVGLPLWTNRYAGSAGGSDLLTALVVASNGNAFVTGQSWNGSNYDYVTIEYATEIAPPTLILQRLANNVVLTWTDTAFGLQAAPALTGTFTNVPGATSPFTNPITGGQRFFRLANSGWLHLQVGHKCNVLAVW